MSCFYILFAWCIAEYVYLMKLRVSNATVSVGQGGRSGGKGQKRAFFVEFEITEKH